MFFKIIDKDGFKERLKKLIPLITTVTDVRKDRDTIERNKNSYLPTLPITHTNVAFSHNGLVTVSSVV